MLVSKEIDVKKGATKEQMEMLEAAGKMSTTFDEDAPELTEENLRSAYRVSERERSNDEDQEVTLRLSPWAIRKAKSFGKEYRAVLSRILEQALHNHEIIKESGI
ncbi:MAG: BrnA antitoxin family protein [Selenomonas sp.]|uniref:BrnA antitoxin family protein n=1 Tax=Selenomonas sp. TaxID=2053611 RepID=UPI0025D1B2FE|nr:BrnA antitoxin family protein [Selenomonas sp.]MCI6231716.1 BrnA antitoxin family protein [Selenomonas sp.]